ncbi:MAG: hypothetical protein J6V07_02935, partial [Clostridia bacterium]|nr:hypothetical protein [Clostridia bacterium]
MKKQGIRLTDRKAVAAYYTAKKLPRWPPPSAPPTRPPRISSGKFGIFSRAPKRSKPMDTVKIEKGNARLIAHRGASALEQENTCAAFLAAANRSYFGIETDLRVTADGYFVTCHDADLKRVAGVDLVIEEAALAEIQAVPLLDKDGVSHRSDLRVPQLCDYIRICRRYEKEAVLELKSKLSPGQVASVVSAIAGLGWLDRTTFIS